MNPTFKNELSIAQRAWVRRVLGVDAGQEEFEGESGESGESVGPDPAERERRRRQVLRSELRTRADNVAGLTVQRLKALKPGSHGASELIVRARTLKTQLDEAMQHADLASDDVPREAFDAAGQRARLALDALHEPWPEMVAVGETQARDAEEIKGRRELLTKAYGVHLAEIGKELAGFRPEIAPGELDTDLRDLQNIVYAAHNAPAFARAIDPAVFQPAYEKAVAAFDTFKIDAEAKLAPMRLHVAALRKAAAALTRAEQAAERAVNAAGPFAAPAESLVRGLQNARKKLASAKTEELESVATKAGEVVVRAELVLAAAAEALRLAPEVEDTARQADATPRGALQLAWTNALETAGEQLGRGEPAATATVSGIEPLMLQTAQLSTAVGLLRERARAWKQKHEDLLRAMGKPPVFSKAETTALLPSTVLLGRIAGDLAATGTLDTELGKLETALEQADTDIRQYLERRSAAAEAIGRLGAESGWPAKPAEALRGQLGLADRTRDAKPAEALRMLEAIVPTVNGLEKVREAFMACWELAPLVGEAVTSLSRNSNFQSWSQKIATIVGTGKGDLKAIGDEVLGVLEKMQAVEQYLDLVRPHDDKIQRLMKSKVTLLAKKLKDATVSALRFAQDGHADKAKGVMEPLIPRLDDMLGYSQGGEVLLKAVATKRSGAPAPLEKVVSQAQNAISRLVEKEDFGEALEQLAALNQLLDAATAYRKSYAEAKPLLAAVQRLAPPATKGTDPAQNTAFGLRLETALDGTPAQVTDVGQDLARLVIELSQAIATRRGALRGALGNDADDPRTSALFDDVEATAAVSAFLLKPGEAALKALIARLGKTGAQGLGGAVAKALKNLHQGMGPEGIEALGNALGGVEKIGALCSEEGAADLANELHKEFSSDLPKLTSVVKDGLGNDPARVRSLVGGGKTGATRLKALSDKFTDRSKLAAMVTDLGTDAEANTAMTAIASTHFGDDWGKFKDPFFDALEGAPNRATLLKKAKNFKTAPVSDAPQPTALSGFASVRMTHVLERHRPENFVMSGSNIKPKNTQFAPGTSPADIARIIGAALKLLRDFRDGKAAAGVQIHNDDDPNFTSYLIDLTASGVQMQIGVNENSNTIDQAFPVQVLGTKLTLDDFSNVDMNKLKTAFGK